jgi:hypothetical protein
MPRPKFIKETRYEYLKRVLYEPWPENDGCMIWPWNRTRFGHGTFRLPDRTGTMAHREAYKLWYGSYPEPCGRHVCPIEPCQACFRPNHIIPGTILENNHDMIEAGRHRNQYTGPLPKRMKFARNHGRKTDKRLYDWLLEKIAEHGDKDECLLWEWSCNTAGIPNIRDLDGRKVLVARLVYKIIHGHWPEGYARLMCEQRLCFAPVHIADVPQLDVHIATAKKGGPQRRGANNGSAKLTEDKVREIRALYATGYHSQQSIADRFGVWQTVISAIIRKTKWGHIE